jgi:hypothetical protein
MAVEFQACSNTVSWGCYTSADNAHMHGYMHMFRVLAVYVQTSYAGFAERVTAQLHLSNQFSPAQLVVTVNVRCHNEHLLAQHQKTAQQSASSSTGNKVCIQRLSKTQQRNTSILLGEQQFRKYRSRRKVENLDHTLMH